MTREAMAATPVTLNGERARVVGTRLDYPRVVNVRTGEGYEWSWATIEHVILHRDGAFTT